MPRLVVLDESGSQKHPIISVGGVLVELDDVLEVELRWRQAKRALGLAPRQSVKYSMSWEDRAHRRELVRVVGELPLQGVVALLEDFRPLRMKLQKETRRDIYIHFRAFEYVLQRLVLSQYCQRDTGPHLVIFDHRDDYRQLADRYSQLHPRGWDFPHGPSIPSLKSYGYSQTLAAAHSGPLVEIADFVVSAVTQWAGLRCELLTSSKKEAERAALDDQVRALLPLFPARGVPRSWKGYSVVVHTQERTSKELLHGHLDDWLRSTPTLLPPPAQASSPSTSDGPAGWNLAAESATHPSRQDALVQAGAQRRPGRGTPPALPWPGVSLRRRARRRGRHWQ